MSQYTNEQLTGTTGAVRDYMDNATEKEKTEKKGQQQWGLFETNYQRNKGISTEQSLNEIEQFCKDGVTVQAGGEQWSVGGKDVSYHSAPGGQTQYANVRSGGAGGQGFGSGGGAGGFGSGGTGGAGGRPGGGNLNFSQKTNAGDAFLQQHLNKEAKKYQPERKW